MSRTGRYEMLLTSHHKCFFFHPYFFAVILATSAVISLVENSVFDYDNITYEIWKAHMVSCIYFAVYWFKAKSEYKFTSHEVFTDRSQQEPLFVAVALAFLSLATTATAPYTSVAYLNFLLWIPIALAAGAFLDVLWIGQEEQIETDGKRDKQENSWNVSYTAYWVSSLFIIIKALVVIYYWRDYSTVWHAVKENIQTRSVQYNVSYAWLSPTY